MFKRRFNVEEIKETDYGFEEYGFRYNVQMLISIDGGKTWSYGGTGRFCKTMEEVEKYIDSFGG